MRKVLMIFTICVAFISSAFAQQKVTGTVTDESGVPVIGVSVSQMGTTLGMATDFDGKFSLTVAEDATLSFTYLGMLTVEEQVNGRSTIDVVMREDAVGLDEVVVTALGIKREEKTLTYANQSVDSEELLKTRDSNFLNSLAGKAAGVTIQKSAGGAGSSTKVVLRGSKSLYGSSDPLFVIDGIPMVNNKGSQSGTWGGSDGGDGMSQVNPDDIESLTILKGANAAVLYGSQGANGVVVITTKSGKAGKAKISFSTSATFESVSLLPELQYTYGTEGGTKESWSTTKGDYDDGYVEDYFRTGANYVNALTISGGNDVTKAYFSYANTSATGVNPTSDYSKNNITFKQSTKLFNNKGILSSNIMLSSEVANNRMPAGYYLNPLTALYMFARDKDFNDYKENYQVFDEDRNLYTQNWYSDNHFQSNPYWIVNKQPRVDETKRFIGNASFDYTINNVWSATARGSYDYATKSSDHRFYAGSNLTNTHANGRWDYKEWVDELVYVDLIAKFNTSYNDFSLNGVIGTNYQKSTYGDGISVNTGNEGLLYPNEFYFQNIPTNVMVNSIYGSQVIKQAIFGNAQIGYDEKLFLDISLRNDWASTFAGTGNESYLYPAVGFTALLHEMVALPSAFSFAKVRGSYSSVANEVPFNKVDPNHTINSGGGVDRNTTKPFTDLNPEIIKSLEFGVDVRLFTGRLGLDLTYYNINSTDQFIELSAPSGSGYTTYYINAGEIVNSGLEITLDGTPVTNDNFSWKTAFNFSNNKNDVVEIHPDIQYVGTGGVDGFEVKFEAGGEIGDLYIEHFQRDEQGRILLSSDSDAPLQEATSTKYGNLNPEWSLGWNNNFSYKKFDLSFMINGNFGGYAISQTEAMLDGYGVSKRSADARDNGYVEINAVRDGVAVTQVDPETYFKTIGDRTGIKEPYIYSRTNIKLNQFALSYGLDLERFDWTFSLVGQNLFMIYNEAPFDPELAMSTDRNNPSLDNFNTPTTRTIGLNVKVNF